MLVTTEKCAKTTFKIFFQSSSSQYNVLMCQTNNMSHREYETINHEIVLPQVFHKCFTCIINVVHRGTIESPDVAMYIPLLVLQECAHLERRDKCAYIQRACVWGFGLCQITTDYQQKDSFSSGSVCHLLCHPVRRWDSSNSFTQKHR